MSGVQILPIRLGTKTARRDNCVKPPPTGHEENPSGGWTSERLIRQTATCGFIDHIVWSEIRDVLHGALEPEELSIVQKTLDRIAEAFVKAAAKAESDMWRAADETSTVGWALLPVVYT